MEFLSVSKDAIQDHVIAYFHGRFPKVPVSELKPNRNVRKAFNFKDQAWRALANTFNKLNWMRQLDVLLSPHEMPGLKTIGDLTSAIWGKLNKVVIVSALATSFKASSVRKFAAPKRRGARKPKSSARKPKSSARTQKSSARKQKSSARIKTRRKKTSR